MAVPGPKKVIPPAPPLLTATCQVEKPRRRVYFGATILVLILAVAALAAILASSLQENLNLIGQVNATSARTAEFQSLIKKLVNKPALSNETNDYSICEGLLAVLTVAPTSTWKEAIASSLNKSDPLTFKYPPTWFLHLPNSHDTALSITSGPDLDPNVGCSGGPACAGAPVQDVQIDIRNDDASDGRVMTPTDIPNLFAISMTEGPIWCEAGCGGEFYRFTTTHGTSYEININYFALNKNSVDAFVKQFFSTLR